MVFGLYRNKMCFHRDVTMAKKIKRVKRKTAKEKVVKTVERERKEGADGNIESLIPSNIQVLGIDEWNRTIIWVKDSRRIWRISKLREIDGYTLIQIAGQDSLKDSSIELGQIKAAIAQISRKHCFGPDDHIGQGIRRIPSLEAILVLSGDRAILTEVGKQNVTFQEIQAPTIKGKLLEFNAAEKWIDLKRLQKFIYKVTPKVTENLWHCLADYLSCWNFKFDTDYDVVAGMILATSIQGTLQFRPHMWVTGATNTGKTALFTFLGRLWPYALKLESETSEAAIRQEIQRSCLPVLHDECEGWRGRRSVIKLLRSSTRGGQVIKGTPGHTPIRFGLHHIFWLASVDTGLRRDVDRNRFIVTELKRSNEIRIPEFDELRAFGRKLAAASLALAGRIRLLYEEIVESNRSQKWGRFAEMLTLPAAVKAAFLNMDEEHGNEYLNEFLESRKEGLAELSEPDYVEVLSSICSAAVMAEVIDSDMVHTVRKKCPIGDLIRDTKCLETLNLYGVKIVDYKNVFLAPQVIQQKLLWNTKLKDTQISDILARIPGAKRTRRRVAGYNCRGIIISLSTFDLDDGSKE